MCKDKENEDNDIDNGNVYDNDINNTDNYDDSNPISNYKSGYDNDDNYNNNDEYNIDNKEVDDNE